MQTSSIRHRLSKTRQQGFTIVELLIVIVVIAILAAITIVSYNGITARAIESSMKSDLQNVATIAEIDKTSNGAYPVDAASANGGKGLKSSGDNQLTYISAGDSFCVSIANSRVNTTLRFKSTEGQVKSGLCVVMVSTLAGSSENGTSDGPGAAAEFETPSGVAVDATGAVYVVDSTVSNIRKITQAGVVSTFAGSGAAGFLDGSGTVAQFNAPSRIAVDSSGVLYVADGNGNNHRVRKITQAGVVSTFAGSGAAGFLDDQGTTARFYNPVDVAVDVSGTVYVADYSNNRIRKITSAGLVSTLAGSGAAGFADGTGTAAQFNTPSGVAVDTAGNVYVSDRRNHCIRKITPAGLVSTLAGSGAAGFADGTGTAAKFNNPEGIAVDASGMVYVADSHNHRIRTITPSGVVSTLAGTGSSNFADGAGTSAMFSYPSDVAVDASSVVYVADAYNHRVRKIVQ